MKEKPLTPAIEGWHTMTAPPHLLGTRCRSCGTYFFPPRTGYCSNPGCDSCDFSTVELSRTGHIWSYTNACYQPPAPYIANDPFEPFALAAVQLEQEQMVVLGQVVTGIGVDALKVGMPVELVLEPLHENDEEIKVTWKWRPMVRADRTQQQQPCDTATKE